MDISYTGYLVTENIEGAHPKLPTYPLLKDDLVVQEDNGTWHKMAPGLSVTGFQLTPEQEASLNPVQYRADGLAFELMKGVV